MIVLFGQCADGMYRIRRQGSAEWLPYVYPDRERAVEMARAVAAGGRIKETRWGAPRKDDETPVEPFRDDGGLWSLPRVGVDELVFEE